MAGGQGLDVVARRAEGGVDREDERLDVAGRRRGELAWEVWVRPDAETIHRDAQAGAGHDRSSRGSGEGAVQGGRTAGPGSQFVGDRLVEEIAGSAGTRLGRVNACAT